MNPLRLLLVTPTFWPLVGADAAYAANLAKAFRRRGWQVSIVTALWNKHWPQEITVREIPLVRIGPAPHSGLGAWKYSRALRRWLQQRRQEFDAAYVLRPDRDGMAVLRGAGNQGPAVVLCDAMKNVDGTRSKQTLKQTLHQNPTDRSSRRRSALIRASTGGAVELVAFCEQTALLWRTSGWPKTRMHLIPPGVWLPPPRTAGRQQATRQVFAAAHPVLEAPPGAPLAVFAGRLTRAKGLARLIEAWPLVLQELPSARLWLVGEGPAASSLHGRIRQWDLDHRIVMTGAFDSLEEVWQAADLYVTPPAQTTFSFALVEAMAAGLPVVAGESFGRKHAPFQHAPLQQGLVADGKQGIIVPPGDSAALAGAIVELMQNPVFAQALGEAARRRAATLFEMDRCVAQHETLFRRLTGELP